LAPNGFIPARYDLSTSSIVLEGEALPYQDSTGGLDVGGPRAWVYYSRGALARAIVTIDSATGERIEPTIDTGYFVGSAATPDASRLAIAADDIIVYDTVTGREVARIAGHFLRGVHITSKGVLLAWTLGGEMTMYDFATLTPLRTLVGNRGNLQDVQSDRDGSMMASLGGDQTVALYDLSTGVAIGDPITVPDNEIKAIALRPDGLELAIGGSLQTGMTVWDLDPDHWVSAACRLAGRNLSHEEWVTNIGTLLEYRPTCPDLPVEK
jgi:WD40 repeat protein